MRRDQPEPWVPALGQRLRVDVLDEGDRAVVTATGEVDISTFRLLREPVRSLLEHRVREIVLDVSAVTFIDSSGLGSIVELSRLADRVDAHITLRRPDEVFARLLGITGLDQVLDVEFDEAH